jgi:hypothetical protein
MKRFIFLLASAALLFGLSAFALADGASTNAGDTSNQAAMSSNLAADSNSGHMRVARGGGATMGTPSLKSYYEIENQNHVPMDSVFYGG